MYLGAPFMRSHRMSGILGAPFIASLFHAIGGLSFAAANDRRCLFYAVILSDP